MTVETNTQKRKFPIFWCFAASYCLIWAILCFVFQANFREDILEQYFHGDQWVFGCGKHPMLSAWYLNFIRFITFNSEISPYLGTESFKFFLLVGIWYLARKFLEDERLAFLTVLGSVNYYFLNIGNQVYAHDAVVTFCWGISIVFFYRALDKNRILDWGLVGFFLGMGVHAKYSIALPMIAVFIFMFLNTHARKYWKTPGPYVSIAVAIIVILPHILWLIYYDFPTIRYATEVSANRWPSYSHPHLRFPLVFIGGFIVSWLPALITLLPILGLPWKIRIRPELMAREPDRFRELFLLTMIGVPLAIHLIVAISGRYQPARFNMPLGLYIPLLLVFSMKLQVNPKTIRNTILIGLIIVFCIMAGWSFKNAYATRYAKRPSGNMFPGHALAEKVEHAWEEQYGDQPCPFVTDLTDKIGNRLSGLVNVYGKHHITVHDELSTLNSTNEEMNRRGGIVLWDVRRNPDYPFDEVLQRYPRAERLPDLTIPYPSPYNPKFKPERIGIAVIPPENPSL